MPKPHSASLFSTYRGGLQGHLFKVLVARHNDVHEEEDGNTADNAADNDNKHVHAALAAAALCMERKMKVAARQTMNGLREGTAATPVPQARGSIPGAPGFGTVMLSRAADVSG